jgi:hypothetical protein
VFLLNIALETILGDVFLWVIPIAGQLLNCALDKIRTRYSAVQNQLPNRHRIFQKLLRIDRDRNHISPAQVQLCMSRVDLELDQFMKSAEGNSQKFRPNSIERSPYAGVWIHQWWLLKRVQAYLAGETKDPGNLFHDCQKWGVKDPWRMTQDELKAEFLVCQYNIDLLERHSPYFRLKFLTSLVTDATLKGDLIRAAKDTGVIQKEASRKRWRVINAFLPGGHAGG